MRAKTTRYGTFGLTELEGAEGKGSKGLINMENAATSQSMTVMTENQSETAMCMAIKDVALNIRY